MNDVCECGHVEDEHDETGECMVDDCFCVYFDAVVDDDDG